MAKWPFIPWRQSTASKFRPDSLNYGCLSVSKSGEVSAGDSNNKAVPVLPTGSVIPFAGKTAPTGWLMCQGQAVSRTTYAQLFSVIGTTFGSGDGSTTFNLPDLRGRVAVGVDSDANLGGTVGEKRKSLKQTNIPFAPEAWQVATGGAEWHRFMVDRTPDLVDMMQPSLYLNYLVKA